MIKIPFYPFKIIILFILFTIVVAGSAIVDEQMACAVGRASAGASMCGIASFFAIIFGSGIIIGLVLLYALSWRLWNYPLPKKIMSIVCAISFGLLSTFFIVSFGLNLILKALLVLSTILTLLFYLLSIFVKQKNFENGK